MQDEVFSQYIALCASGGCFVLFVISGAVSIYLHVRARKTMSASQGWSTTNGQVVLSKMEELSSYDSESGSSYSYDIRYTYQAAGQDYIGRNVLVGGQGSFMTAGPAKNVIARYPTGKQVMVFYDPNKPADAALELSVSGRRAYLIVGILLLAGAACMACSLVYIAVDLLRP